MVTVKSFGSRNEADLARDLLVQANIPAFVLADDQGGMIPSLAFTNGVRLQVSPQDVEKARILLDRNTGI